MTCRKCIYYWRSICQLFDEIVEHNNRCFMYTEDEGEGK